MVCDAGHFVTCRPGARIEEFIYDKLDKKLPSRTTNPEVLGQYMLEAAKEFGAETPYGEWIVPSWSTIYPRE